MSYGSRATFPAGLSDSRGGMSGTSKSCRWRSDTVQPVTRQNSVILPEWRWPIPTFIQWRTRRISTPARRRRFSSSSRLILVAIACMVPTEFRKRRSVWTINPEPFPGSHFAVMPTKLVEPCILAGCPEGGVVLEPFMGSGTVPYVATKFGRKAIGIELNESYLREIAIPRIESALDAEPLFAATSRQAQGEMF